MATSVPATPPAEAQPATLELAYLEVKDTQQYFLAWSDAIANRAIGLFGVSSLVVALVPALANVTAVGGWRLLWLIALACWAAAAVCCFLALYPATLRVGPEPAALLDARWTSLPAAWYHRYRLEEWAEMAAHNRPVMAGKAAWLRRGLILAAGEVLALAALVYHTH